MGQFPPREQASFHRLQIAAHGVPYKRYEKWTDVLWQLHQFYSRLRATVYEVSREICNLGYRMKILQGIGLGPIALRIGPTYQHQTEQHLTLCKRTRACSEGMRNLQKRFPWMTQIDRLLAAEAWEAGWESHAHQCEHSGSYNQVNDKQLAP
jgi:hypothetical protein